MMLSLLSFLCVLSVTVAQCPGLPRRDTSDVTKNIYDGSFRFAVQFFNTLAKQTSTDQNVFTSPFSIYNALLLAYFGSAGKTQAQLERVLHLRPFSKEEFAKALLYDDDINSKRNSSSYVFEIANRVYLDSRLQINPCLLLGDSLQLADFSRTEKLRQDINKWVQGKTRNRIRDLVQPNNIMPNSAFALINAAYFKGKWESQFKPQYTNNDLFYPSEDEQTFHFVRMMYQKGTFRYGVSETLQAYLLELPYIGGSVSMYILLPPYVEGGLDNVLKRLTPEALQEAISQMYPNSLEIYIPKFKIEMQYELQVPLYSLGLSDLFDPTRANLTEFANVPGLSVGAALHKAFIQVDEEGSEAAAATALIGFRRARPLEPEKFAANHPFIYIIYDNYSNTVLFMGIMRKPNRVGENPSNRQPFP